jgi:hypothetical protein
MGNVDTPRNSSLVKEDRSADIASADVAPNCGIGSRSLNG